MKTIKVGRLWNGFASLRDYQIDKAIENNYSIRVVCQDKVMTLSVDDLITKGVSNTDKIFQSSRNLGQTYRLVDYPWVEDAKLFQDTNS